MSNYFNIVLAKHDNSDKVLLFKAPCGKYFDEGDRIIVETKKGDFPATVVGFDSYVTEDSSAFKMLVKATGATLPLKRVIARFIKIDWPEEIEETEETEEPVEIEEGDDNE